MMRKAAISNGPCLRQAGKDGIVTRKAGVRKRMRVLRAGRESSGKGSEPGRCFLLSARLRTMCRGASVRYRFSLALTRFEAPLPAGFVPLGFEAVVG